jgi:hypothetical protein
MVKNEDLEEVLTGYYSEDFTLQIVESSQEVER